MKASSQRDGDPGGQRSAHVEGAEDDLARVDFLLSKVRETLLNVVIED